MDGDVGCLIDGRRPGRRAGVAEIPGQLGLAIDHHPFAAGQFGQIDAMADAVIGEIEAVMRQALAAHARADLSLVEKVDRALFEHARADARLDIGAALAFEDDRLDARPMQQMAKKQPGRPGADNGDLRALSPPSTFGPISARWARVPFRLNCYIDIRIQG